MNIVCTHRLTNGLRLHHYPRPGSGVIGLALALPVGARQDPPNLQGLSHMLEHMLFNGTEKWSETQLRDEVERRGGYNNGLSTPDRTVYTILLPAAELAFGLDYFRQLVFAPALPVSLLDREKRIIASETSGDLGEKPLPELRNWLVDRALNSDLLDYTAMRALLKGSRLEQPPAGHPWTRRHITIDHLQAHHRQHYLPNNAALIAVGDIETARFVEMAEAALGLLPSGARPAPPPPPSPAGLGQRRVCWIMTPQDQLELVISLSTGILAANELPAFDLLLDLIEDELMDRLRTELGYIYAAKVGRSLYADSGIALIRLRTHHRHMKQTERESLAIFDRLSTGQFQIGRFERVKQAAVGRWIVRMSSAENQLYWLCNLPYIFGDTLPLPMPLALAAVSPDDVRQLSARLLKAENRLVVVHQPSRLWMAGFWLAVFGALIVITSMLVFLTTAVEILLKLP